MWHTERLTIEPLAHEHAEELVAALDHESVGAFIGGPDVTTVEAMHERIDRLATGPGPEWPDEQWWNFAVRRSADGAMVGRLEATTYGDWAEVAYVFGPALAGRGYATEGVRWLVGHVADVLSVAEQWAAVHPDNLASIRLLERVGFRREPTAWRPIGSFDDGDLVFHLHADPPAS